MVWLTLTRWTWFWPKMMALTLNGLKLIFFPGQHGLTKIAWWDQFSLKFTVLTRNGLKLIFYRNRHDLTHVDLMYTVLTENDDFDPKRLEIHFLPRSTWFHPYCLVGSIFTENDSFTLNSRNSFFILVDTIWLVLTLWTWFWPKMTVLIQNSLKLIFLPWSTWFDLYCSEAPVFPENDSFDLKWPEILFFIPIDKVSWKSKRKSIISQSLNEAEYCVIHLLPKRLFGYSSYLQI